MCTRCFPSTPIYKVSTTKFPRMLIRVLTCLVLASLSSATCPQGTFPNTDEGHCFYVVSKRLPWPSAEKMCQVYGGHLASVPDDEANSLLNLSVSSSPRLEFWLGGHSRKDDWKWTDGSEFKHTNWDEGGSQSKRVPFRCN